MSRPLDPVRSRQLRRGLTQVTGRGYSPEDRHSRVPFPAFPNAIGPAMPAPSPPGMPESDPVTPEVELRHGYPLRYPLGPADCGPPLGPGFAGDFLVPANVDDDCYRQPRTFSASSRTLLGSTGGDPPLPTTLGAAGQLLTFEVPRGYRIFGVDVSIELLKDQLEQYAVWDLLYDTTRIHEAGARRLRSGVTRLPLQLKGQSTLALRIAFSGLTQTSQFCTVFAEVIAYGVSDPSVRSAIAEQYRRLASEKPCGC